MNVMDVQEVSKSYGETKALKNLTISLEKNKIHGFLGPNGAGKSTAMSIMAGLVRPDSGRVLIHDEVLELSRLDQKKLIAILPEEGALYPDMTTTDYLKFIGELYLDKGAVDKKVEAVISRLDLYKVAKRLIGNLSRGYKQRIGIAQVLMTNAEILFLDEPTLGLDPETMFKMREILMSLKSQYTVVISSHLLHEMGQICDNITLLNNGEINYSGSLQNFLSNDTETRLVVKCQSYDKDYLNKMDSIKSINTNSAGFDFVFQGGEDRIPEYIKDMVEHDFRITHVSHQQDSLEDAFKRSLQ